MSASRSFGFVLKAIGSHAPRRAHAAAAAAAALPSSSSHSLQLNAALLRRKAAAAGGARCLSTESAAAAPPRARGTLRLFVGPFDGVWNDAGEEVLGRIFVAFGPRARRFLSKWDYPQSIEPVDRRIHRLVLIDRTNPTPTPKPTQARRCSSGSRPSWRVWASPPSSASTSSTRT